MTFRTNSADEMDALMSDSERYRLYEAKVHACLKNISMKLAEHALLAHQASPDKKRFLLLDLQFTLRDLQEAEHGIDVRLKLEKKRDADEPHS